MLRKFFKKFCEAVKDGFTSEIDESRKFFAKHGLDFDREDDYVPLKQPRYPRIRTNFDNVEIPDQDANAWGFKQSKSSELQMLFEKNSYRSGDHMAFDPSNNELHATFPKQGIHNTLAVGTKAHELWQNVIEGNGLERRTILNTVKNDLLTHEVATIRENNWHMPTVPNVLDRYSKPTEPYTYYEKPTPLEIDVDQIVRTFRENQKEKQKSTYDFAHLAAKLLKKEPEPEYVFPVPDSTPAPQSTLDTIRIKLGLNKSEESRTFLPWESHLHYASDSNPPSMQDEYNNWGIKPQWHSPTLSPAEDSTYELMKEQIKRTEREVERAQHRIVQTFQASPRNIEKDYIEERMVSMPAESSSFHAQTLSRISSNFMQAHSF